MQITTSQLAKLAKEAEITDPIEWGELTIQEDVAYEMMAASVIEMMSKLLNDNEKEVVAMASIVKLLVENFVLNLKQGTAMI
jgi:hypothetical protein